MAWQTEVFETYRDRHHAGVELARRLTRLETSEVVVPKYFAAAGQWYDGFRQTTDEDVRDLLRAATAHRPVRSHGEAVS